MTYVVDTPRDTGRYRIAVVSKQSVNRGPGVAIFCSKQPAFVVVCDKGQKHALDMTGATVPLETVVALCPAIADL